MPMGTAPEARAVNPAEMRYRAARCRPADLHTVLDVEVFASLLLRIDVLGMATPGLQRFLGFEFDDGDSTIDPSRESFHHRKNTTGSCASLPDRGQ